MDAAKAQELKDIRARKLAEDPEGMRARKKAYDAARYAANRDELLAKDAVRRARRTAEQREAIRQRGQEWREANREHVREYMRGAHRMGYFRDWRARRRATDPTYLPRQRLLRTANRYGITPERYEAMLAEQGGLCAICHQAETAVIKGTTCSLAVDHDRRCCSGKKSCGKCVRGLLCGRCNMALGGIKESAETLRAMAAYLELHSVSYPAVAERGARAAS